MKQHAKKNDTCNPEVKTASLLVLKTEKGYLHNVWESYDEEKDGNGRNYDFTSNPLRAWVFSDKNEAAPKHFWDSVNKKHLETACEVCDFLNGRLVKIEMKTTVIWREKEVVLCD